MRAGSDRDRNYHERMAPDWKIRTVGTADLDGDDHGDGENVWPSHQVTLRARRFERMPDHAANVEPSRTVFDVYSATPISRLPD